MTAHEFLNSHVPHRLAVLRGYLLVLRKKDKLRETLHYTGKFGDGYDGHYGDLYRSTMDGAIVTLRSLWFILGAKTDRRIDAFYAELLSYDIPLGHSPRAAGDTLLTLLETSKKFCVAPLGLGGAQAISQLSRGNYVAAILTTGIVPNDSNHHPTDGSTRPDNERSFGTIRLHPNIIFALQQLRQIVSLGS